MPRGIGPGRPHRGGREAGGNGRRVPPRLAGRPQRPLAAAGRTAAASREGVRRGTDAGGVAAAERGPPREGARACRNGRPPPDVARPRLGYGAGGGCARGGAAVEEGGGGGGAGGKAGWRRRRPATPRRQKHAARWRAAAGWGPVPSGAAEGAGKTVGRGESCQPARRRPCRPRRVFARRAQPSRVRGAGRVLVHVAPSPSMDINPLSTVS